MAHKTNINFKKIALAIFALALALPVFASSSAFAEGECVGPTNYSELSTAINQVGSTDSTTITLCGNITYQRPNPAISVNRGNITINLNGFTVTGGTNTAAISVGRERLGQNRYNYGSLTIEGEGTVSGPINVQYTQSSLSLKGGTYTANNAGNYVASGYNLYSVNGKNVVAEDGLEVYNVNGTDILAEAGLKVYGEVGNQVLETELTENNFTVSSEYMINTTFDAIGEITIRKNETLNNWVTVNLPADSTSNIVFMPDREGVVEVSADGKSITGIGNGYAFVTIFPAYDSSLGIDIIVNVYSIEPSDEENDGDVTAADTVKDLIDNEWPKEEGDISDNLKETFGEENVENAIDQLDNAMYYGKTVLTSVTVEEAEPTEDEVAAIKRVIKNVKSSNISYYDVTISMLVDNDEISTIHKLNRKAKILLAEVTNPADGFKRTYYVVRYHNGEAELLIEGEDYVIEDGKIYLLSDKFSLFALGYKDSPITTALAPDTGVSTNKNGAVSANMSVISIVASAAVVLTGAAVFAKRK